MTYDIPSYLRNQSLGLGTSSSGDIFSQRSLSARTSLPRSFTFATNQFSEETRVYQKNVLGHFGCINSICLSPDEELLLSGGDDRRIVVWHTSEVLLGEFPKMAGKMKKLHYSNIFALAFSADSKTVYSGGNDSFFASCDIETGKQIYGMQGLLPVHNISVNEHSNEVMITRNGGRDGVYFHDPRTNSPNATLTFPAALLYSAEYNPDWSNTCFAVCGENLGVRFIDRRNIMKPMFSTLPGEFGGDSMYGRWNRSGTKFAHLVSRDVPVVFDFKEGVAYRLGDEYHPESHYKNNHTIKSLDWMDDDWIISGSDDFNIYGWNTRDLPDSTLPRKVPEQSNTALKVAYKHEVETAPKMCLQGHRSIVNHAIFSPRFQFILSCGIEKIIKVWNTRPFPFGTDKPNLRKRGSSGWAGRGDDHDEGDESGGCQRMRRRTESTKEERKMRESTRMLRYFDTVIAADELSSSEDEMSEMTSEESESESEPSERGEDGDGIRTRRLLEDTDQQASRELIPDQRVIIGRDGGSRVRGEGGQEDEDRDVIYRRLIGGGAGPNIFDLFGEGRENRRSAELEDEEEEEEERESEGESSDNEDMEEDSDTSVDERGARRRRRSNQ